jgi:hypothetical protein
MPLPGFIEIDLFGSETPERSRENLLAGLAGRLFLYFPVVAENRVFIIAGFVFPENRLSRVCALMLKILDNQILQLRTGLIFSYLINFVYCGLH